MYKGKIFTNCFLSFAHDDAKTSFADCSADNNAISGRNEKQK